MEMLELLRSTGTVGVVAVAAFALAEIVKRFGLPEDKYRYIPGPLILVTIGIGVLVSFLFNGAGQPLVQGGVEGLFAGCAAVFGWEFFEMFKPRKE